MLNVCRYALEAAFAAVAILGAAGAHGNVPALLREPITLSGPVGLEPDETFNAGSTFDPKRGYLYIAPVGTSRLTKIRVATATSPAQRVSATPVSVVVPDAGLQGLCCDVEGGFVYVAESGVVATLHKFAVGEGDNAPEFVGASTAGPDESVGRIALYDPITNRVVMVCTGPGGVRVVVLDAGAPGAPPVRLSHLDLPPPEGALTIQWGALDPGSQRVWLTTVSDPARVIQVSLNPGAVPPVRDGAFVGLANGLERFTTRIVHDPLNRVVYAVASGLVDGQVSLFQFDVSGALPVLRLMLVRRDGNDIFGESLALDGANGILYRGFNGPDSVVTRLSAARDRLFAAAYLGEPLIGGGAVLNTASEIDPVNGFYYSIPVLGGPTIVVVRQNQPSGLPDLQGAVLKVASGGQTGKFRASAQFSITNAGAADAGAFEVRFFVSADRELSHDDVPIGKTVRVRKLAAGKSRKVRTGARNSATPLAGKHLIMWIDPANAANDTNLATNRVVTDRLPEP